MSARNLQRLAVLFVCSTGLVNADFAYGEPGADPHASAAEHSADPTALSGDAFEDMLLSQSALETESAAHEPAQPVVSETKSGSTSQWFSGQDETTSNQAPSNQSIGAEFSEEPTVNVGSFGMIDLHVKDLDVTKVLQLLSIQAQRNVIATKNVNGSISADLYQVNFYDAMDAILHPNGYGYEEKGNFIYVYTSEELERIVAAREKPVTKVFRLNYLTAGDASTYVSPLLSGSGTISVSAEAAPGFQPSISGAGEKTNALGDILVIRDFKENVEEMSAVLEQLDVRPKQVMVEATILEARLDEDNALGVDINAIINFDFDAFTSPISGVVDDIIAGNGPTPGADNGTAIQTTVGGTKAGASGVKIGFLGNDVNVFIRALDQVTDTTVIAKPKLLALNRMPADLLVGQRLGYISTQQSETTTTQTVEFLEVGTQLSFRAFIGDDDFIRLELRPSVSDGSTQLVGGFVIPTETTNEMTTNVIVRSGQTVVLGGLFKEKTDIARSQVPFLGDIPILGAGFRGQDDEFDRTEVIFLIKPTIVKDEALTRIGDRAMESTELIGMGAKEKMLPWSRTRQTTGYLHRALAHMKDGRKDQALWNVNMALELDPLFVDAIRLKQELTGKQFHVHDGSMLEDAINRMVIDQIGDAAHDSHENAAHEEALHEQALHEEEASHESEADKVEPVVKHDAVKASQPAPDHQPPSHTKQATAAPAAHGPSTPTATQSAPNKQHPATQTTAKPAEPIWIELEDADKPVTVGEVLEALQSAEVPTDPHH